MGEHGELAFFGARDARSWRGLRRAGWGRSGIHENMISFFLMLFNIEEQDS